MNNTADSQNLTTQSVNNATCSTNTLTITAINVNSLFATHKRFELLELARKSKSDIVLISETKLNNRHNIQFKEYNIIRTDRPSSTSGGGTAIMIKENIKYDQIHFPSSARNKLLEYTIINIDTNSNNKLYIASIYATNNGSSATFIKELEHLLNSIKDSPNLYFILAGDFNIKSINFGNLTANQRGIHFDRWETNASMQWKFTTYPPCEPTYTNANSFLDICLAESNLTINNTVLNNKLKTLHYDSDHKAITFNLTIPNNARTVDNVNSTPQLNYKATNWHRFKTQLEEKLTYTIPTDRDLIPEEIDAYLKTINSDILNTIEATIPRFKRRDNILIYVNPKIKKLQKQKSHLISLFNRKKKIYPNSTITQNLKNTINSIKALIKSEFTNSINQYWQALIKQIDHRDPSNFFPSINKIFRKKNQSNIDQLHILN